MKILKKFTIETENQNYNFELRENGMIYLIENENIKSSFGQIQGTRSIREAIKIAKEMLYTSGKLKNKI